MDEFHLKDLHLDVIIRVVHIFNEITVTIWKSLSEREFHRFKTVLVMTNLRRSSSNCNFLSAKKLQLLTKATNVRILKATTS